MAVTSTPKIKDDSFFDDYSVIQQYQAEKQLINEEDKRKGRSNESNSKLSLSCCLAYCNCRLVVTGSCFLPNRRFIFFRSES
jgi:hypothetical protein